VVEETGLVRSHANAAPASAAASENARSTGSALRCSAPSRSHRSCRAIRPKRRRHGVAAPDLSSALSRRRPRGPVVHPFARHSGLPERHPDAASAARANRWTRRAAFRSAPGTGQLRTRRRHSQRPLTPPPPVRATCRPPFRESFLLRSTCRRREPRGRSRSRRASLGPRRQRTHSPA